MTEKEFDFSLRVVVLGNLGLLAWIFLAAFAIIFYNQIYGWLYLILEAAVVYSILRKLGCHSGCLKRDGGGVKCKVCTIGFGRLAGTFFGKGLVKKTSVGNRIGLIAFVYFLLLPLPVAILFLSLSEAFSFLKVLVLFCLLAVSIYSLTTWYNRSTVAVKL